jgi:hypothetical protein
LEVSFHRALVEELEARPAPPVGGVGFARASSAGGCSRAVWYRAHGEPVTDPSGLAGLLSMQIGTDLHRHLQRALQRLYPDARLEVAWARDNVSGHADALYTNDNGELTIAEFYATQIKPEHLLQASIYALALDAEQIHVVYVNTYATGGDNPIREFKRSPNFADAAGELARLSQIAASTELVDAIYDGAAISPEYGTYPCTYCNWRSACRHAGI